MLLDDFDVWLTPPKPTMENRNGYFIFVVYQATFAVPNQLPSRVLFEILMNSENQTTLVCMSLYIPKKRI